MGEGLLKVFAWMPNIESFCGAADVECGAYCSVILYFILAPVSVVKPIFTFAYHHESETFIAYVQFVVAYIAAFCGFFGFYISLPMCFGGSKEKGAPICNVRNNVFSHLYLLLCLILGLCEVLWGISAFARAFIEPGLLRLSNKSYNPHPKSQVCKFVNDREGVYIGRNTRRRRRTTCRPVTDEEVRKRKQWDLDHANDTVFYHDSQPFDAIFSMFFVLIHLYGFYPLIALRCRLVEDYEAEEEQNAQNNQEQEMT